MPEAERTRLRVFISSPADVRPERLKAEQIVARLDREFSYHFHVEPVLWEREPLVAAHHFQDPENIPQPRGCDIVVVVLWSRLGVPLPADRFRGALSGRCPVTGTEWEFEDALAGARERGVPDLLFYRKTAEPVSGLGDRSAVQQRLEQLDLVDDFIGRWFRSAGDESLTAASHSFATTGEFEEQLYEHLHALLARRAGGAVAGTAIRWHEAPFRALLSYEYEHAPVFFGRTRARNELRELLARQIARGSAFVLVFGASGSGKSSLVKAGLLPDLALPGMIGRVGLVRRAVMRPADIPGGPLAALAAAILAPTALPELAGLQYTPERLSALLNRLPEEARLPIEQGLAAAAKAAGLAESAEARLALVVDQLEEIFTIDGLGAEAREAFVGALAALATSGLVWVVATMRSDFFDRLETMPALAGLSAEARFLLLPPDEAAIGQIIRLPAQEAGLRFEHDAARGLGLDETIRQAAARDRAALPLLSFLLDQLWQKRSDAGLLTFAAYQELGALEGAIGRRAEEVFEAQPAAVQSELVAVLRALVTVQRGTPTARPAPLALFPEGSPRRALVEAFLHPEARLLVGDRDAGRAQIRLAHEALLTHWLRAKDQVAADARDLELRGRLEEEAESWRAAPRRERRHRVIAGLPLAEARALLARWGAELPAQIRDFIAASRHAARRRRWRLGATVAGAVVSLPVIAGLIGAGMMWRGVRAVEAEMKFVSIPSGCFAMGSPNSEVLRDSNEGPVHRVCVKAFDLDRYDVTQWEWRQVMVSVPGFNFPFNSDPSYSKGDRRPVEQVSWNDAWWFVHLISFFGRHQYRLPSEAEWEYAARAGTTTPYYWGERAEDGCAYESVCNAHSTAPVGSFKPNPWGLYDMLGNAGQWVEDCYVGNYSRAPTDGSAVTVGDCKSRVIRGNSWFNIPWLLRAEHRRAYPPIMLFSDVGFRVARTIAP